MVKLVKKKTCLVGVPTKNDQKQKVYKVICWFFLLGKVTLGYVKDI